MATGIILAGGQSRRMPVDKAFMEVAGRPVIEVQLEVLRGLFDTILIVGNAERVEELKVFESGPVRVLEEPVRGKGPLGGIQSGLLLSPSDENFILACDMPFIRREAVSLVMRGLEGFQVSVPRTPGGLEPLHAAYSRDCLARIEERVRAGDLKATSFYADVKVNYLDWELFRRLDPSGRLFVNINSPGDMRAAAGVLVLERKEDDRSTPCPGRGA